MGPRPRRLPGLLAIVASLLLAVVMFACGKVDGLHAASASISPDTGGTLTLDEVTLDFPPGAVSEITTVTIAHTSAAAPPVYVAHSGVYAFEPRGLAFAVPVGVTIRHRAGAASEVYWTRAGSTTVYQRIGGEDDGTAVVAAIDHFSTGFAGAVAPDAGVVGDGGAPVDPDAAGDPPPDDLDAGSAPPTGPCVSNGPDADPDPGCWCEAEAMWEYAGNTCRGRGWVLWRSAGVGCGFGCHDVGSAPGGDCSRFDSLGGYLLPPAECQCDVGAVTPFVNRNCGSKWEIVTYSKGCALRCW